MKTSARIRRAWFDVGLLVCLAAAPIKAPAATSNNYEVKVSGRLVKPPCSAQFPGAMPIDLGQISRNELSTGRGTTTEVHLSFECVIGSRVTLKLLPGNGQFDSRTLHTSLPQLGVQIMLSGPSLDLGDLTSSLGSALSMLATGTALGLTLQVKPVLLGEDLPASGAFTTMLLMEMTYQ